MSFLPLQQRLTSTRRCVSGSTLVLQIPFGSTAARTWYATRIILWGLCRIRQFVAHLCTQHRHLSSPGHWHHKRLPKPHGNTDALRPLWYVSWSTCHQECSQASKILDMAGLCRDGRRGTLVIRIVMRLNSHAHRCPQQLLFGFIRGAGSAMDCGGCSRSLLAET